MSERCEQCGKPKCAGEMTLYYDGGFFSCSVCDSVFVAKLPNQAIYRCHGNCAPQPVAEPEMSKSMAKRIAAQRGEPYPGMAAESPKDRPYFGSADGEHPIETARREMATAPPPASEASDLLTGLIEAVRDRDGYWYDCDDEDMVPILLALRVLRVLRVGSPIHAYATASGEVRIDTTHPLGCSGSLDDAERLLGIGGE